MASIHSESFSGNHHGVVALEGVALAGERLARNAGDPPRVGDQCHDGGRRYAPAVAHPVPGRTLRPERTLAPNDTVRR